MTRDAQLTVKLLVTCLTISAVTNVVILCFLVAFMRYVNIFMRATNARLSKLEHPTVFRTVGTVRDRLREEN